MKLEGARVLLTGAAGGIGAAPYGDDDRGSMSGSAYFFELCEAKKETKLTASDGAAP